MPSVLAEIAFVSNPHDEKLLSHAEQRQKVAEALFKGISGYANSLSHVEHGSRSELMSAAGIGPSEFPK